MSSLANLNDQQNLTLTQISYSSNMLSKHHGKTFGEIADYISKKNPKDRSEEEAKFLKLMEQFPSDNNPLANYKVVGTANNSSSGFGAVCFSDEHGNTGFSYRGTDGPPSKKSINDWLDNGEAAVTGDSKQCQEAEEFFEKYSDPNGNNYLYGHSKGGNLSEYVFVRNHENIKGMHLLNPQPLNPMTLSAEQMAALQSDKVDIVVVEGDYVWFLGLLPSYGNVRVVDSNDNDSHSYWSINFNEDGSVSKGNHPLWEYFIYALVLKYGPIIQGFGAIFGFICDCAAEFVKLVKKGWEKCKEFIAWVTDKIKKFGKALKELANDIGEFFTEMFNKVKNWYNKNLNKGFKYATANPQIVADTYKLRQYAQRLQSVNSRVTKLDFRLDSLYWQVGLLDLWNLMHADLLTSYSWRINRCVSYLNETAGDFERVETDLINKL